MAIAPSMKNLCEEIVSSYKARVKDLDNLTRGVRAYLDRSEAERLKDYKSLIVRIREDVGGINAQVRAMLGAYRSDIDEAAAAWRKMASSMAEKRGMKPAGAGAEAKPVARKRKRRATRS